jgi:hypothetical protein
MLCGHEKQEDGRENYHAPGGLLGAQMIQRTGSRVPARCLRITNRRDIRHKRMSWSRGMIGGAGGRSRDCPLVPRSIHRRSSVRACRPGRSASSLQEALPLLSTLGAVPQPENLDRQAVPAPRTLRSALELSFSPRARLRRQRKFPELEACRRPAPRTRREPATGSR